MGKKLYAEIASMVQARENCQESRNEEWFDRHTDRLRFIERNCLPSGSGIDSGCQIDLGRSKPDRVILTLGFHHVNQDGYYDEWTHHDVVITPSLQFGYNLRITGRNRNDIKNCLHDTLSVCLDGSYTEYLDGLMLDGYRIP